MRAESLRAPFNPMHSQLQSHAMHVLWLLQFMLASWLNAFVACMDIEDFAILVYMRHYSACIVFRLHAAVGTTVWYYFIWWTDFASSSWSCQQIWQVSIRLPMCSRNLIVTESYIQSFHTVGLEIAAHPSSLLVPINEVGVFTCVARSCFGCSGYWIIDSKYSDPPDQFIAKGFIFPPMQRSDNELLMTLKVNASEIVNNSEIYCEFDPNGGEGSRVLSRHATLLVIASKKA